MGRKHSALLESLKKEVDHTRRLVSHTHCSLNLMCPTVKVLQSTQDHYTVAISPREVRRRPGLSREQ